jgi:hypothetical protein
MKAQLLTISESSTTKSLPVWPLPAVNKQSPVVLVHDYQDPGVELAYEQLYDPDGPMVRAVAHGDEPYFVPSFTPVFAVHDGSIVYAGKHASGYTIILQHGNGWMTYYGRLEHMLALETDRKRVGAAARVKAGSVIGYAGSSKPGPLRALRFELWRLDDDCGYLAIDPIRFMRRWAVIPWTDHRLRVATAPAEHAA